MGQRIDPSSSHLVLLDTLPAAICIWEPDTTIVWANRIYTERIGGGESVVGRRWLTDFVEPGVREEVALQLTDLPSRPRPWVTGHGVVDWSGLKRHFLWVNTPFEPQWDPEDGAAGDFPFPSPSEPLLQSVGVEVPEEFGGLLGRNGSGMIAGLVPDGPLRNLAGGVAHGVNSHLATILSHGEMALDTGQCPEPVEAHLLEILAAVGRCGDLTRTLLSFAARRPFFRRPGGLDSLMEEMIPTFRRVVGRNIPLRWMPGAGEAAVKIDPERLEEAVENLLTNARDAILAYRVVQGEPEHGVIVLSTEVLHGGRFLSISVQDDGLGMEQAVAQRALEPFFSTKRGVGAQGLGLPATQGFALQNGGSLEVDTAVGLGTTVRLLLPRAVMREDSQSGGSRVSSGLQAAVQEGAQDGAEPEVDQRRRDGADPAEPRPADPATGSAEAEGPSLPPRILLVEDDEALIRVMARFLTRMGYRVECATNAQDAAHLARVHRDDLDLLITDVIIPGKSGVELQELLAAQGIRPPCLFISGFTADFLESRLLTEEGIRFLAKPFSLDALASQVGELMGARRLRTPGAG